MAGSGSKWLAGCGVGCLIVVLLLVGAGTAVYLKFRSRAYSLEEARAGSSELERRFGRADEYCPPSAVPGRDRLEAFLDVRRRAAAERAELEAAFAALGGDVEKMNRGGDTLPRIFGAVGRVLDIVPKVGGFMKARNQALLDVGMGQGEYSYLYGLIYYTWLGKSPADGPSYRIRKRGGVVAEDEGGAEAVRRDRNESVSREIRRRFMGVMRRQLSGGCGNQAEAAPDGWRDSISAELAALESDPGRIPWQGGVPPAIGRVLEPFRRELSAGYSALVNPVEITFSVDSGGWGEAEAPEPPRR